MLLLSGHGRQCSQPGRWRWWGAAGAGAGNCCCCWLLAGLLLLSGRCWAAMSAGVASGVGAMAGNGGWRLAAGAGAGGLGLGNIAAAAGGSSNGNKMQMMSVRAMRNGGGGGAWWWWWRNRGGVVAVRADKVRLLFVAVCQLRRSFVVTSVALASGWVFGNVGRDFGLSSPIARGVG